ncbi:MAG: Lipocalin-like domain [Crocinitomicaceae bacterium]|jgi:hypothetical protein|nr:Lipocalin-like domain [Crocinitomicaceae bacterium]
MNKVFLLSLFSLLFVLGACTNKSALVGSWKLEEIDIEKAISIFDKEQKNFARMMMEEAFKNVKGKMKISFVEDGKYKIETPLINGDMKSESGTWKLSLNGKKLTLKPKTSDKEVHRILKLTSGELVMEMNQPGFGKMEMTFLKD